MQHSVRFGRSSKRFDLAPAIIEDVAASRVLALVSAETRIAPALLLHRSRCQARVARVRHLAMYLLHVVLSRTLTEIGALFGRDRTSVAHACGRVEDARDDLEFDAFVCRLELRIESELCQRPPNAHEPQMANG